MNGGAGESVWKYAGFSWLLAARSVVLLGNSFGIIALAFAILGRGWGTAALGIFVGARSISNLLSTFVSGALSDLVGRRRVLIVGCALAAAGQAGTALLFLQPWPNRAVLFVLVVVTGTGSAVVIPTVTAIIPEVLPESLLQKGNSFLRFGMNSSVIAGSAMAGVTIAATSPVAGLFIDAGCFLLGALAAALGVRQGATESSVQEDSPRTFWRTFRHGGSVVMATEWLWRVILGFGLVNVCFVVTSTVLGPAMAVQRGGARAWGLVLTMEGIGLAAGSLIAGRIRFKRPLHSGIACAMVIVLPIIALVLGSNMAIVGVAFLLSGMGVEIFGVMWDTTLQSNVPATALGSIVAFDYCGSLLAVPVGEMVVGPIAAATSFRGVLAVFVLVIALAMGYLLAQRSIFDLRTADMRTANVGSM